MIAAGALLASQCRSPSPPAARRTRTALRSQAPHLLSKRRAHARRAHARAEKIIAFLPAESNTRHRPPKPHDRSVPDPKIPIARARPNSALPPRSFLLGRLSNAGPTTHTTVGTPLAISGGFALTYTIKTGPKKYAVRCFHRESKALERRYQAIGRRLAQLRSPYFLDFEFQPKGIRVDGNPYPVVKMAWAQGLTLGEFLEDNHGQKRAISKLPDSLLALSKFLEAQRVAHGDIQTGNMMVSGTSGAIQLIDYDGMFVEEIRDVGSSELGHINFQHPERKSKNPFGPTVDRFSLIALSLALKALHEDPSLWKKTHSEVDAIVFRAADFVDPAASAVFSELMGKPALATHAQRFAAICRAPIEKAPSLDDFLAGRNIPAGIIQISAKPQESRPRPGYMGVYDVLPAASYEACLRRVGDKVEVIGRIVDVKEDRARNGKPFVFINFGDWRGQIFKVAIWSEGLALSPKIRTPHGSANGLAWSALWSRPIPAGDTNIRTCQST